MALNGMKIAVVVPAFNESKLIGSTLGSIPSFVDSIFAIDDASTDSTFAEMKKAQASDPRVLTLQNFENLGVGGSISKGYSNALKQDADICVVMDGDGQMPPEYLEDLLKPILAKKADVAKGNRFFSKNSFKSMPAHRVFGNLVFSLLNKIGSGYWGILDPQNGYIASSARVLEKIDFRHLTKGYAFQNAYLCAIKLENAVLVDVPIPAKYGNEVSTMPIFKVTLVIFQTLILNFINRIFRLSFNLVTLAIQISYLAGIGIILASPILLTYSILGAPLLLVLAVSCLAIGVVLENIFEKVITYR